ncbi:hypothetical protein [Alkalicoccus luteus]|uniref:Uncharacterized protein n=1 Tax=Alkalicoccus luteus TaxID=1237094 RepID=A0A969PRK4_9BACI|nr:hypothetical protein [Alkalicoccus luteus]NJP37724.1 hypothetical protein [Alkalicoccus luteus]
MQRGKLAADEFLCFGIFPAHRRSPASASFLLRKTKDIDCFFLQLSDPKNGRQGDFQDACEKRKREDHSGRKEGIAEGFFRGKRKKMSHRQTFFLSTSGFKRDTHAMTTCTMKDEHYERCGTKA